MTKKSFAGKQPLFIGIDIGTSRAKGALYDAAGRALAQAVAPYMTLVTGRDLVEQDANEWLAAAGSICRQLAEQLPVGSFVKALAFSTQGGSLVAVDQAGRPLANAIIWSDQRGRAWRDKVSKKIEPQLVFQKTGWQLGNGLNLLQIVRLAAEEPAVYQKTHYYLSVSDFLSLHLTGRPALDSSNAGINQLMDVHRQIWDQQLLAVAGIREEQLADVVVSGEPIGRLLPDLARQFQLPAETILVSGAHDQYCAAIGAGASKVYDRLVGTGTAWVMVEIGPGKEAGRPAAGKAFSRHVVPGLWGELISLSAGGASLEWLLKALTYRDKQISWAELDSQVAERLPNKTRPYFYPYFSGASHPHSVEKGRALFSHLAYDTSWPDLAAAVMEGVAMQVSWMWDAFGPQQSDQPLRMTGGASHSKVWRQLFANILGRPLAVPGEKEVGCLGAAMLAAAGSGFYSSILEASHKMTPQTALVKPNADQSLFEERFATYKEEHSQIFPPQPKD